MQHEQIERLGERLPLPNIELPFLFTPDIGRPQVDVLADALHVESSGCDDRSVRDVEELVAETGW